MRRFELHRDHDPSGVSGTGVVAEGVEWSDGRAALHWLTAGGSTCVYDSTAHLQRIHGHGGATRVVWLDSLVAEMIRDATREVEP